MKRILFIGVAALFVLSGCAPKSGVEKDLTKTTQESATKVEPVDKNINETKVVDNTSIDDKNKANDESAKGNTIESIHFPYNIYTLDDAMQKTALDNYKLIANQNPTTIKVDGNCDEWGSDEYNYALGLKRAKTVKDSLVSYGYKGKITIFSFGESNPSCTDHTDECWAKNRRVDYELGK
jgi:peptidoglycan-associated lipoprotein